MYAYILIISLLLVDTLHFSFQDIPNGNTACIRTIACHGIGILESEKILLGESGFLGFGIGNTAQELRQNPTNY